MGQPAAAHAHLNLLWALGYTPNAAQSPGQWVPAAVPGAVQLDWARAEGWPPYWQHEESLRYAWMEDKFWIYRTQVEPVEVPAGAALWLEVDGVDHAAEVRVAGETLARLIGPESRLCADVTARLTGGGEISLVVQPAPKRPGASPGREEADHTTKAAVSYSWDWHPRLIPLGLSGPVRLTIGPAQRMTDCHVSYDARQTGVLPLTLRGATNPPAPDLPVQWQLTDADGAVVIEAKGVTDYAGAFALEAGLAAPRWWWPHDQGEPHRYRSEVILLNGAGHELARAESRVGLRRMELVMPPGGWDTRKEYPMSRNEPPITLRVNGRDVFAKGSNWVPPEIFPAQLTAERLRPLLELARGAHFNLLRCWGGAAAPPEAFFELCDELGLMVWAEFPLACNAYAETADYLAELDGVSQALIRRLRRHPCLALWCGGNELFNRWSGMTDQARPLRLLNRNCYDLDPATPFIATAPLEGMAHGNYLFRYQDGREVHAAMPTASATAYTEFGVPGPADEATLRSIIPAAELFPPKAGGSWSHHHAYGAWQGDTWLGESLLRDYFGPAPDLATLVAQGQWLQAEGYKCIFEEARRQKPRCAMALNWCYCEPWPCAANNSLIVWPTKPKPAYAAVRAACRPTLASARLRKFAWGPGEEFACDAGLLHDAPAERAAVTVGLRLEAAGYPPVNCGEWLAPAAAANTNLAGPTWRVPLPDWPGVDRFTVRVVVKSRPDWDSSYVLRFRPAQSGETLLVAGQTMNV